MKDKQYNLGKFGFQLNKAKNNDFDKRFAKISNLDKTKAYEEAQKNQKTAFLNLLDLLLSSIEIPKKDREVGHPFSNLRDIIFCCAIKVYLGISSRRLMGEIKLIHELGYIQTIPSFTVINHYMRNKELNPIIKRLIEISSLPLRKYENTLCIDSSGFSSRRYLAWQDARLSPGIGDKWVKAHLCIGDKSMIIVSVDVTKSSIHDNMYFKPLLKSAVSRFDNIKYVCCDKAYSSKDAFNFARNLNIEAYIPFKSNVILKKFGTTEWDRKFNEFINNPEEFDSKYHRRSLVESVFWMVKAKHFQKVFSKDINGAMNEALLKCLIHNIYILTVFYYQKQNETI